MRICPYRRRKATRAARFAFGLVAWNAVTLLSWSAPASSIPLVDPEPTAGKTYHLACGGPGESSSEVSSIELHSLEETNAIPFKPGDRLLLKRGTTCNGSLHPRGSGTEKLPIRIGAYGEGPMPRIVAASSSEAALQLFNQEYWDISSLDLSGSSTYGLLLGGDAGLMHHFHLRDLRIHDVKGALKRKESGLLVVWASGKGKFDDVSIDGIRAWNTTQWAGIFVFGAAHVKIRNSMVHDVQGDGIVSFESSDVLIARSVAWHTGMQHVLTIGTPNAIWTWRCTDCMVEENEAFLTDSPGVDGGAFDIDYGNTRNTVQRNFGHDTVGYCVSVFGASGPTIHSVVADNLCIHNGLSPRLAQRQGAILLMTWLDGTLDGVELRGNRVDWQPAGDSPAIQSGFDLRAQGIFILKNEITTTGLSFVDPALKYKGNGNRYVLVNADAKSADGARQRLAALGEINPTLSTSKCANEKTSICENSETVSGEWQLVVNAPSSGANSAEFDLLRGMLVELESAALQYGNAGLKATLVGGTDLRTFASDFFLEESGVTFREDSGSSRKRLSMQLISPRGTVVREWEDFPGPVELGLKLRERLGNPNFSHLTFEDVHAIG